ncbi:hypothetical protein FRB99_006813 [Tulasnella sp. 403]|nr:hypothetical protein FRB99_006813 [Tulasnella sp. 403]
MAAPLYHTESGELYHAGKIIIICVGLPARGKTHISRALERYLHWMGVTTKVFSMGDYRRRHIGGAQSLPPDYFTHGPRLAETQKLRTMVKVGCEGNIMKFFREERGQVAIYDANNGTKRSRKEIAERFAKEGIHVIFLGLTETSCTDPSIIDANIRGVKIWSPDYKGWDPEEAVKDYWKRIQYNEAYYEPLAELTHPYIKIVNVGEEVLINAIEGYLQSRIIYFLMNMHNKHRTIYFARSGQSLIEHSYKADSDLSPAGWEYAEKLKNFVVEHRFRTTEERAKLGLPSADNRLVVWTSTRRRAHHTAWPFVDLGYRVVEKQAMSEINPGVWDGLSPETVQRLYPDEWARFLKDPFAHRAPRAESYYDLNVRLESTIIELERERDDLLIIAHASVIRCLLAYLMGLPAHEVPAIEIARGDLVEVVPASYGVQSRTFHFWSGPGRASMDKNAGIDDNFYENYAEATQGKKPTESEPAALLPTPADPTEPLES